ncbi:MAG: hypothetical protein QNJ20_11310 [Paracoccaceae bacterium]|nr:hypothetical protein [Paracoccaceae bacterium]
MKVLVFLISLLPLAANAGDRPISAEEFERLVTGKTYTYAKSGIAYGAEAYLPNRRVQWTFLDGECSEGEWFVSNEQICFVYDDIPGEQCWNFYLDGGRLQAEYVGDGAPSRLYETKRQSEPLVCLGPKIGV